MWRISLKVSLSSLCTVLFSALSGQGSGVNIAGRIESGYVQCGESILVLPANELASVRSKREEIGERESTLCNLIDITINEESSQWSVAGDQVVLTVTGIDHSKLT